MKLSSDAMGNDEWLYTFTLERQDGQAPMDKALCHPTADEMDDWNDYKKVRHGDGEEVRQLLVKKEKHKVINWMMDGGTSLRYDSGYFGGKSLADA